MTPSGQWKRRSRVREAEGEALQRGCGVSTAFPAGQGRGWVPVRVHHAARWELTAGSMWWVSAQATLVAPLRVPLPTSGQAGLPVERGVVCERREGHITPQLADVPRTTSSCHQSSSTWSASHRDGVPSHWACPVGGTETGACLLAGEVWRQRLAWASMAGWERAALPAACTRTAARGQAEASGGSCTNRCLWGPEIQVQGKGKAAERAGRGEMEAFGQSASSLSGEGAVHWSPGGVLRPPGCTLDGEREDPPRQGPPTARGQHKEPG